MNQTSEATITVTDGIISHISEEAGELLNQLPEQLIGQPVALILTHTTLHTPLGLTANFTTQMLDNHRYQITLNQLNENHKYLTISSIYPFLNPLIDNIKKPLTTIQLSAEILLQHGRNCPDEQHDEYLHTILNTVSSLSSLLDTIRANSTNMNAKCQPDWEQINLRTFCRSVIDEQMAYYSHVTCEVCFEDNIQYAVVNPPMFRNMIANILSNAAKYSPSNSVIHMTVQATADDLIIIIEDQGLGMTTTDLNNLFTPFYKGDIAKDSTDAGLGLTIVKHSVEAHQGSIHFDSAVGKGTTVTITIPNQHIIKDSNNEKVL